MKQRKILVAFYSWGGNTKAVAEYIKERTGADIYEICPIKAYPSDYNECVRVVGREGAQYEPELKGGQPDIAKYDLIFIGSPCWWGTIANPVRTFLHQNDFKGKTIAPFMTNGTSGKRLQDVKRLCQDAKVDSGLSIYNCYQVTTKKNTPDNLGDYKAAVDRWLETL